MQARRRTPLSTVTQFLIISYRNTIAHILPPSCRFLPTCSEYAIQAIGRHGAIKGLALSLWRIIRCHPLSKNVFDPVR